MASDAAVACVHDSARRDLDDQEIEGRRRQRGRTLRGPLAAS
jgi:hypothetical protein